MVLQAYKNLDSLTKEALNKHMDLPDQVILVRFMHKATNKYIHVASLHALWGLLQKPDIQTMQVGRFFNYSLTRHIIISSLINYLHIADLLLVDGWYIIFLEIIGFQLLCQFSHFLLIYENKDTTFQLLEGVVDLMCYTHRLLLIHEILLQSGTPLSIFNLN